MKLKRIIALLLSMIMVLSMVACNNNATKETQKGEQSTKGEEESTVGETEPSRDISFLNPERDYPVIKDGEEKKTLKILVCQSTDAGPIEESWLYEFLADRTNLNLEFTGFTDANRKEILSLAFASNELPDMIIGGSFTTAELIKYGATEGQLIDLAPYINDEVMPNLAEVYKNNPSYKSLITDPNGKIWSLGEIANPSERTVIDRIFTNYDWLEAVGVEPYEMDTLDEFIDAMKKIQAAGLCKYPIGGSYKFASPLKYILNAFGYVGSNSNGSNLCLRNGKVVLPYADREVFGEYLKVMRQIYQDQLIHPDFYTMDSTTTQALLAEGTALLPQAAFLFDSDWTRYWAPEPLTSQWNDKQVWTANNPMSVGGVVVTSACEWPEVALKFVDFFYNSSTDGYWRSNYRIGQVGYEIHKDDKLENWEDWFYSWPRTRNKADTGWTWKEYKENLSSYSSLNDFLAKHIHVWRMSIFGYNRVTFTGEMYETDDWDSMGDVYKVRKTYATLTKSGDRSYAVALQEVMMPFVTDEVFPHIVFMEAETSEELNNLKIAFDEYATQEIAKFITGAREINDAELKNYFDTMDSLGAAEYVKAFADYYASIQ